MIIHEVPLPNPDPGPLTTLAHLTDTPVTVLARLVAAAIAAAYVGDAVAMAQLRAAVDALDVLWRDEDARDA